MSDILIDSSAWIDFFRGDSAAVARVDALLADGRAAICGPIFAEVVSGAQQRQLFDREKQITPGKRRRFLGTAEEIASDIREYRQVGVDTMIFDVRRPTAGETLERMQWMAKEVIAKV